MTKKDVEQLASLQRWLFSEVANNDQSKIIEVMEVMWYWMRKQIFSKVMDVMIEAKDFYSAHKLETSDIQISEELHNDFCVLQGELIRAEGAQEDSRMEKWLHYVGWVSAVIDQEVLSRVGKYMKIQASSKNGKQKRT
jgi:hypothetical protein